MNPWRKVRKMKHMLRQTVAYVHAYTILWIIAYQINNCLVFLSLFVSFDKKKNFKNLSFIKITNLIVSLYLRLLYLKILCACRITISQVQNFISFRYE